MTETGPLTDSPATPIRLSVDAMGGDNGAKPVVAGIRKFLKKQPDAHILLHGPEATLRKLVKKRKIADKVTVIDAPSVVSMQDKPSQVMRNGKGTSMWSALESVRDGEAQVCVSSGNTGALMALAMLRLRKAPGVNRPAIAGLWPSRNPTGFNVMLDIGADIRADENDLLTYALMGAAYARSGVGIERPRVGLLNIGTEEHKGPAELKAANELLRTRAEAAGIDYVGFVEGSDIPSDRVDVIVTDGFTGNIALKTGEGTASLISELLRGAFKHSPMSRFAAVMAATSLTRFKKRIDPRRVNGGVFLGLNGTVVKSHGSSDATGTAAALTLAWQLAMSGFSERVAERVASAIDSGEDAATESS